ncbi:MAG: universal stress protein [Gaiellaceae bacterium]
MKRILIAVDGSDGSGVAVQEGLKLADAFQASVTFVSVTKATLPVLGDPYYQRAISDGIHRAQAALTEAMSVAEETGVVADYELLEGDAAEQVVGLGRRRGVDLIVAGSRGLGSIKGALLGSVSSAIVRHSDCPVLVAKASGAAAQSKAA